MVEEPKRIKVAAGSELDKLLTEASDAPLVLEKNGELYRLARIDKEKDDIGEWYDPDKLREAIKATAGKCGDLDAHKLIEDIYRAREGGSRPADRPFERAVYKGG